MKLAYYTREFTEGTHFPATHIFLDEEKAREAMIEEAYAAINDGPTIRGDTDSYITTMMDAQPVARKDLPKDVDALIIQWADSNGAVDCFQLFTWEIERDAPDFEAQLKDAEGNDPVAIAHSYDGHGYQFIDNGSGSDWIKRGMAMPDATPLYAREQTQTVFEMGIGDILMSHGSHEGLPMIAITKAPVTGVPGEDADGSDEEFMQGATVIRFHNVEGIVRLMDRIKMLADDIVAAAEEQRSGWRCGMCEAQFDTPTSKPSHDSVPRCPECESDEIEKREIEG